MNNRVNFIACALVAGALAVPVSHAGDRKAPADRIGAAPANAFVGLGHEGSALRKVRKAEPQINVLQSLGHEGSGLVAKWEAANIRPWAS
jgi:hypothetical protein